MRIQKSLLLLGALAALGGTASANEISYTTLIPDKVSPWTQTLSIPQFNTGLGTLTNVEISTTLDITASITFVNMLWNNGCLGTFYPASGCLSPQPVHSPDGGQTVTSATATVPFTLSGPSGLLSGSVVAAIPGAVVVSPRAITNFLYLCTAGGVHGSNVNEGGCFGPGAFGFAADGTLSMTGLTNSTTIPFTSVPMAGWSGPGVHNVNFTVSTTNTNCFRDAHDGVFVNCGATAGGSFSVKYTFVPSVATPTEAPEPTTLALMGSAMFGLGLFRMRKRTR
jgi:hypothetical protein